MQKGARSNGGEFWRIRIPQPPKVFLLRPRSWILEVALHTCIVGSGTRYCVRRKVNVVLSQHIRETRSFPPESKAIIMQAYRESSTVTVEEVEGNGFAVWPGMWYVHLIPAEIWEDRLRLNSSTFRLLILSYHSTRRMPCAGFISPLIIRDSANAELTV